MERTTGQHYSDSVSYLTEILTDSVSISVISQDGRVKFHCMNSVELILLKCIPRGHPNPCSRVGLSCSIFKNTSATCAYPLVSNARKLKRDKRTHACAQFKAPSRTRHVREGALRKIYVFPQICTFQKTYVF